MPGSAVQPLESQAPGGVGPVLSLPQQLTGPGPGAVRMDPMMRGQMAAGDGSASTAGISMVQPPQPQGPMQPGRMGALGGGAVPWSQVRQLPSTGIDASLQDHARGASGDLQANEADGQSALGPPRKRARTGKG